MRSILVAAVVVLALAIQAGLGRVWPGVHPYVDVLLVPVAWLAVGGSQRSAMWIGCASGLLHDAWFEVGSFGVGGFKLTLIGWLASGLAARVDFNHAPGRLVGGFLVSLADTLIEPVLLPLLGRPALLPGVGALAVQASTTGLLTVLLGSILDRMGWGRKAER